MFQNERKVEGTHRVQHRIDKKKPTPKYTIIKFKNN